jgi:hypothetical protein
MATHLICYRMKGNKDGWWWRRAKQYYMRMLHWKDPFVLFISTGCHFDRNFRTPKTSLQPKVLLCTMNEGISLLPFAPHINNNPRIKCKKVPKIRNIEHHHRQEQHLSLPKFRPLKASLSEQKSRSSSPLKKVRYFKTVVV